MKTLLGRLGMACCIAVALVAATASPSDAWGRDRHSRGGPHFWGGAHVRGGPSFWWGPRVYLGPPVLWAPSPYPYYSPHYYSPPVVVESPPVYVEQQPATPGYWYYCQNPNGYYPYVSQCPGGWTPVAPTPPAR